MYMFKLMGLRNKRNQRQLRTIPRNYFPEPNHSIRGALNWPLNPQVTHPRLFLKP